MLPHRTLKRAAATAAVAALAVVGAAVTAAPASAATCSVSWGSTAKKSAPMSSRELTDVRSGRHTCYDRLVIDLNGAAATSTGYDVRYVPAVQQDGSGLPVPLRVPPICRSWSRPRPTTPTAIRRTARPIRTNSSTSPATPRSARWPSPAASRGRRPSVSASEPGSRCGSADRRPRHGPTPGDRRRPPLVSPEAHPGVTADERRSGPASPRRSTGGSPGTPPRWPRTVPASPGRSPGRRFGVTRVRPAGHRPARRR